MASGLQLRRDTAANWTSADPTLAAFEEGWEIDTDKGKLGDGSTAWTSLPYTLYKVYLGPSAPSNHNWIWIDTS